MGRVIIADASRVSPLAFFDAVTGGSADLRAAARRKQDELCIRLIELGSDMYGWPPATVERCKAIIAERQRKEAEDAAA